MFGRVFIFFALIFAYLTPMSLAAAPKDYQEYVKFFEKVYQTFEDNYYLEPNRQIYNDFLKKFRKTIYAQLKSEKKSDDYVRWRSAWYLVDALKSKEDRFSQFYPPKPAVEFKHEAMGQLIDLGIEGRKNDAGFLVTRIEPRSDAFEKGLRELDVLLKLDGQSLKDMAEGDITKRLNPLAGTKAEILYLANEIKKEQTITVESKEYFKQTVFPCETPVAGVFCLEIPKFNRTTGDDMLRFLSIIEQHEPRGLVLDLRGNPGGPPLAAREIAAFFLKGGEEFTHFQKRGIPPDTLDVPVIPEEYRFKAPIVILVNEMSGSASELFSGIMQFRGRAVVMGTNTAGQCLLKSTFSFDDGSMVGLVTAPGYFPDGTRFSFSGLTPDTIITDAPKDGLINLAAAYLAMKAQQR